MENGFVMKKNTGEVALIKEAESNNKTVCLLLDNDSELYLSRNALEEMFVKVYAVCPRCESYVKVNDKMVYHCERCNKSFKSWKNLGWKI